MAEGSGKPKELKPWDRRPWPDKGTKSLRNMYAAVGRTLSQWERHEFALSRLFTALVTSRDSLPAARAYCAVRTFEGRADMLRAASAAYFLLWPEQDLQKQFKIILSHAASFSPRRNDIAHGVVDYHEKLPYPTTNLRKPRKTQTYALYPSYANFKDRAVTGVPEYCYTEVELDYFYGEFLKLVEPAFTLAGFLMGNCRTQQATSDKKFRELFPPPTNQDADQSDQQ
jgi:hypothetical protein